MSFATAPSVAAKSAGSARGGTWPGLGGLKILLPFAVLAAIWWAIKAVGDFPDNLLVSPLQAWNAFVHLVTHGVLAEYAAHVTSVSLGAVTDADLKL